MTNISETIPINIFKTPDVMENVFIGVACSPEKIRSYMTLFKDFCDMFAWSYDEMPRIDPRIVQHEI